MKMILPMKELMKVDHNLLMTNAINADKHSGDMRFGHSRLDALQDAGIKIYSRQEWKKQSEAEGYSYKSFSILSSPYPLVLACLLGCKRPVIEKLIAIGADVNDRDEGGITALMYACYHGHGEIVT
ncbi:MAG TPA: hypothetical protein DCW33_02975, partial [Proteobacteria bacterium]|nr:hypothetical protein [Pseudomonadota bacterium]